MLAHGFSDRALSAQEHLIRSHVDRLVRRLDALEGQATNAVQWLHHIAYDIIAHLCFGQDSKAVEWNGWCPQARVVFEGICEGVVLIEILRFVPFKLSVLNALVHIFGQARLRNFQASVAKVKARLDSGDADNVDFGMAHITPAAPGGHISDACSVVHPSGKGVRQAAHMVGADSQRVFVDRRWLRNDCNDVIGLSVQPGHEQRLSRKAYCGASYIVQDSTRDDSSQSFARAVSHAGAQRVSPCLSASSCYAASSHNGLWSDK